MCECMPASSALQLHTTLIPNMHQAVTAVSSEISRWPFCGKTYSLHLQEALTSLVKDAINLQAYEESTKDTAILLKRERSFFWPETAKFMSNLT